MYTLLSPTAILSCVPTPDGVKRRIQALESVVFDGDDPITVSRLLARKNVLRISQEHLLPMAISYVPFKGKIADVAAGGVRRLSDGFGIGGNEVKDVVGVLSRMPLLRTELGGSALNLVQQFAVEALKDVRNEQDLENASRLLHNLAASLCADKGGACRIEEVDNKKGEEHSVEAGKEDTSGKVVLGPVSPPDAPAEMSNVGIHPTNLKLVKALISCVPFNGAIARVTQGGVRTISGGFDIGHKDIHKALVILGRLPLLRTQVGGAALGLVDHFTADALAPKSQSNSRKRIENHIHITIPTLQSSASITCCDCSDASFILQDNLLVSTKPPCTSLTCRRLQVNPSPSSNPAHTPEIVVSTPSPSGSSSSVISIASSTCSTSSNGKTRTSRKSLSSSSSSSNDKGKGKPTARARSNSGPNSKGPRQHHSLLLTAEIAVLKCLHAMFDYSWDLVVRFLGGFVTVVELVDESEEKEKDKQNEQGQEVGVRSSTKVEMKAKMVQRGPDPEVVVEEDVDDGERSRSLELEGKIPPSDSEESVSRDEASDVSSTMEAMSDEDEQRAEHEHENAPLEPCDDDAMQGAPEDEENEEEPLGFDETEAWVPPPVIYRPIFTPKIDHAGRAYFSPVPGVRIPRTNEELARMSPELNIPGRGMSPMRLSEISPPGSRKHHEEHEYDEDEDEDEYEEYMEEEDDERGFDDVDLDDAPRQDEDQEEGYEDDDEEERLEVDGRERSYESTEESEEIDEVEAAEGVESNPPPSDPPTYSEYPTTTTEPPQRTSPSNNPTFRSQIPVASPQRLAPKIAPIQTPSVSPPLSKAIGELRANISAEKMLRSPAVVKSPPRQEGRLRRDGAKSPPSPTRSPAKDLPSKYFVDPADPTSHKALPISTPLMDKYGARFKRALNETPASPSDDAKYFMQPSGGTSVISSRISPLSENESLPAQESPLDGRALRIAKARGDALKLAAQAPKVIGHVSPLPQPPADLKLPKRTWEVYRDPSPTHQPSPTPSEHLEIPDPKPPQSATTAANKATKKNKTKKKSEAAHPPSKKTSTMKKKENPPQPTTTSTTAPAGASKKVKDKKANKDKKTQNQKPKEPERVLFPKYIEDLPNPIPPLPFRMPLRSKPTDTPPTTTTGGAGTPTSTSSTKTSSMSGVENVKPTASERPFVVLPMITINSPGSPAPMVKEPPPPAVVPLPVDDPLLADDPDLVRAPAATEMLDDPVKSKHPAGLPVAKANDDVHLKVVSHGPIGESPSDDGILDHFFKADQTDPAFFDMLIDKDMPREDSSFIKHSGEDDEECWDWDGVEAPDLSCWLGKALAAEKRDVQGPLTSTPLPEGRFGKGFKGKERAVSLSPPPVSEYIPPPMERARSAPAPGGTPSSAPRIFRSALQPRPRPGSAQKPSAGSSVPRALR